MKKLLAKLGFRPLGERRVDRIVNIVASFALLVLVGALCMAALGFSPMESYGQLVRGMFVGKLNLGSVLEKFTNLLLTGLAFVVAAKAGFANMGVEGQMYLGAMTAAWLGVLMAGAPPLLITAACVAASMLVGALWALIPALLKTHLGTNEICVTIMLNYIAILFTTYLVMYPLYCGTGTAATVKLDDAVMLTQLLPPSRANTGLILALLALLACVFLFRKTALGYRITSVGLNPAFSESAGISGKRYLLTAVLLSGAVGGLAGSVEVLGIHGRFINQFSNNLAFDGMLAALLAQNGLGGLFGYSLFIGALKVGALGMERFTGIPKSLIDILIGLFILLAAMNGIFSFLRRRGKAAGKGETA